MSSHPAAKNITVLLVDDQRLMREGLRTLLELHPDMRVVGEADDSLEAEDLVGRLRPTVVLMDLRMPRRGGVAACAQITARWPAVQVPVLTIFDDDELVFQSLAAGASGYLLKDVGSDALAEAVRAASRGEYPLQPRVARKVLKKLRTTVDLRLASPEPLTGSDALTSRELDVLTLLGTGAANREIGDQLGLTEGTVKNYIPGVLAQTGVRDRTPAALLAVRRGLAKRGP